MRHTANKNHQINQSAPNRIADRNDSMGGADRQPRAVIVMDNHQFEDENASE